jgi:hypothetical protein
MQIYPKYRIHGAGSHDYTGKTHLRGFYSDFQSYKVHLSPLIACGEGVGGGVLVPGLMTICCKFP